MLFSNCLLAPYIHISKRYIFKEVNQWFQLYATVETERVLNGNWKILILYFKIRPKIFSQTLHNYILGEIGKYWKVDIIFPKIKNYVA